MQLLIVINSNFWRTSYRFRNMTFKAIENGFFSYPFLVWRPRSGNLLEFLDETYPAKTRVTGLRNGENFMILTSTAFTDSPMWQTNGRTGDRSALSMLPRAENRYQSMTNTSLPARRYASAGYSDRNVSVRLSVRHAPVLCQNEES